MAFSAIINNQTVTIPVPGAGTVYSWGFNNQGQVGNGTTVDQYTPYTIPAQWMKASASQSCSIGIKSDGKIYTWGRNALGQLGDGTTTQQLSPQLVPDNIPTSFVNSGFSDVLSCVNFQMALKTNGEIWSFGQGTIGQLGHGSAASSLVPVKVTGSGAGSFIFTQIGGGTNPNGAQGFACGLTTLNEMYGWGDNGGGQFGVGFFGSNTTTPLLMPTLAQTISKISCNGTSSFFLNAAGALYGTGYNAYGQLGDNTLINKNAFFLISSGPWIDIDAGEITTHLLDSSGAAFGSGRNISGQIGDGTLVDKQVYTAAVGGNFFTSIKGTCILNNGVDGTEQSTAALTSGGQLFKWGYNLQGQQGDGTSGAAVTSPASISAGWNQIYRMGQHTIAKKIP